MEYYHASVSCKHLPHQSCTTQKTLFFNHFYMFYLRQVFHVFKCLFDGWLEDGSPPSLQEACKAFKLTFVVPKLCDYIVTTHLWEKLFPLSLHYKGRVCVTVDPFFFFSVTTQKKWFHCHNLSHSLTRSVRVSGAHTTHHGYLGVVVPGKSNFLGVKVPLRSFHRNEIGSASITVQI